MSCAWGTDEPCDSLYIGLKGANHGSIPIRSNLAAALYQLRKRDDIRILWIDAVCINQSNEEERNHQVALMTEIYRFATKVLVWLGGEDANSSLALETLDYLGAQVECCRSDTILRSPDCREKWWYRSGYDLQFTTSTWTAIHRLIERAWFERLWIWQEVHLANLRVTVHCGPKSVPFYNFRRGLICLKEKQKLPSAGLRTRLEFVDRLLRDRSGTDFPGLLSVTRLHKATNPKDRIYGILGIAAFASLEIVRMIKTDYSLDLENVYRDAFLSYLTQSGLLTLLRDCNLEQRRTTGPTWVPDWSVPRNSNPLNYYFLASGGSRAVFHIDDKDRLIVTGVEVDKIVSVGAGFATQPDALKASVIETVKSAEISTNIREIPQDQVDTYLITLCAGQIRETCPQIPAPTLPQCRTSYEALSSPGNPKSVSNDFYLRQVRFWSQGRVFFQSSKSIGLAPTGTEQGTYYKPNSFDCCHKVSTLTQIQGDVVCVLLGCNVPIVLRPLSTGGYSVVGEAYVHNFMNSEAFLGQLDRDWRVQVRKDAKKDGYFYPSYYNVANEEFRTTIDPRLRAQSPGSEDAVIETVHEGAVRRRVALQEFVLL